jgi:anti-anti-sigma factor
MNTHLNHLHAVFEHAKSRTIIRFAGSGVCLDDETIERVRHHLLDLAESPGASELVLDLENVHFISSSTLGTLITMRNRLAEAGRLLTLCNLHPHVREVFAITCWILWATTKSSS